MPFAYYENLSASQQRTYRTSDAVERIPLKSPRAVHDAVKNLKEALENDKRRDVAKHASAICRMVCKDLDIEPLTVKIRSRRPTKSGEELQGLYEPAEGEKPVLTVWMKTAAKGQVVAFKSFMRTVFHELCHHIDYEYFGLEDSFHTEGFFKRESFLFRQTVPPELQRKGPEKKKAPKKPKKKPQKKKKQKPKGSGQLELF
jgi:hypothetical protein